MKYFNTFKIFDSHNQILYRKPSFEEIYLSIINEEKNNIINESVFENKIFKDLFNYLKNMNKLIECFNTEMLKDYFSIKSKVFKILSKNKNRNNYKLYIVYNDFSNFENVKNILNEICNFKVEDNEVNLIYDDIKNSSGLFTPLTKSKEFGILWLYKDKSSINDFKHKFIHYLEWVDGIYGKNIKIDLNKDDEYFEGQNKFLKLFHLEKKELNYIFDRYEYQTLLNNFLDLLEEIKKKYFLNLTEYEFAKRICFDLKKIERNDEYLDKIKDIFYLKEYLTSHEVNYELAMIIGYFCMDYKEMNIKNHIFGRFQKRK